MGREIHYNPETKTWSVYSTVIMYYVAKDFKTIRELVQWLSEDFIDYKERMERKGFSVPDSLPELKEKWRREAIEAKASALMTSKAGKLYFPVHIFTVRKGKLRREGIDLREVE